MKQTLKPELKSPETKEAYIAAHWGQKVLVIADDIDYVYHVFARYMTVLQDESHLLLTPLNQISLEDAIEVIKIFGKYNSSLRYEIITKTNSFKETFRQLYVDDPKKDGGYEGIDSITVYGNFTINGLHSLHSNRDETYWKALDYLRSRGYALPWNGYKVEELIEAGYCQLKGGGDE